MMNVAIDGPAGAGKSTIARAAAENLGFVYVDTGALYRTVALYALENGVDIRNETEISGMLKSVSVDLKYVDGLQRMFLCGEDVTDKIRTPEVAMAASVASGMLCVREFLFELQRSIAEKNNIVMDGRDIGTVVLPDAEVKIFLTASAEIRAKRRFKELIQKDMDVKYDDVLADVILRDKNDTERKISPLRQAEDAVFLDTGNMSLAESIDAVIDIIKKGL